MSHAPAWDDFRRLRYSAGGYLATREISQRLGAAIAYAGWRLDLSPATLTWTGLVLNLAASAVYAYAPSGMAAALIALLLYESASGFDCADGQLARATGRASAYGAWLDLALDYVRCILIAGAVVLTLRRLGLDRDAHLLPALPLLAGMVISAHTGIALRDAPAASGARRPTHLGAQAMRLAIDTPCLFLALCALRDWPMALATYCAAFGLADCIIAGTAAYRRLGRG